LWLRPYKRATRIAQSIIKMIENNGGGSAEIANAAVLLPASTFDELVRDQVTPTQDPASGLRIQGITFERMDRRRRRAATSRDPS
jgi:hypothetical protein